MVASPASAKVRPGRFPGPEASLNSGLDPVVLSSAITCRASGYLPPSHFACVTGNLKVTVPGPGHCGGTARVRAID